MQAKHFVNGSSDSDPRGKKFDLTAVFVMKSNLFTGKGCFEACRCDSAWAQGLEHDSYIFWIWVLHHQDRPGLAVIDIWCQS